MNRQETLEMLTYAAAHDPRIVPDSIRALAWHDVLDDGITAEWTRGYLRGRYGKPWSTMLTAAEVNQAWQSRSTAMPWCGECDEVTRLAELPDGRPYRCRCHPRYGQPTVTVTASSADRFMARLSDRMADA